MKLIFVFHIFRVQEPGCRGYNYGELLGIFAAANATKSDVIFQWWTPDALHNMYAGTDSEFQAVGMPLPTLECIEHTVSSVDRCDPDPTVRRGSSKGACGEVREGLRWMEAGWTEPRLESCIGFSPITHVPLSFTYGTKSSRPIPL